MNNNFWETKKLDELTDHEWESLCDGCGLCCLIKLEDEQTGILYYTNVACRLFDSNKCQCKNYSQRLAKIPGCVVLRPYDKTLYQQLPISCAYRRLAAGQKLESWHPLISNSNRSVHIANISVQNKVISEEFVHELQLEEHIIDVKYS